MITRKRVRVSEGVEPETKSLDSNDVDVCDLVGIVDCTQPASYEQICPESEDSTELDLEDFLSVDDLNWNFDQEGLSSIFDMGTTGSSDVSSTVANRGRTDQDPDMDELFSSPKRSGGVKKTQECKRSLPGRVNKNAIAARMNRLKKKEYVNGLEKKVTSFASENISLRQENSHLVKRVEELEDETRYLRAVLANESMLAQLLSRLSGVNGMKLSTSLFQESSKNDHDYALPRKRVKVEEKDTSGGICLHVDKNHVSVEFCTKCAESASTSLKM